MTEPCRIRPRSDIDLVTSARENISFIILSSNFKTEHRSLVSRERRGQGRTLEKFSNQKF